MEKGFLDIFYDPETDGIYSRNVDNIINTLNTNNLFFAAGYPLNASYSGINQYRGDGIQFKKGEFCGVTAGEGLAKLQPFALQTFTQPFLNTGTHTPAYPTVDGLLNDPEDVNGIGNNSGIDAGESYKTYPANISIFRDNTFPDWTGELRGIDINGDGYGFFNIDYGGDGFGDVTGNGVGEDDCVSNVIDFSTQAPRAYKIAPRVLIMSEHFRPVYKKFGRCANNSCNGVIADPQEIRFRGRDENGNNVNVTIPVLATHFARDKYEIDPASAGMPEINGQPWQDVLGGTEETLWESRDWYDTIYSNYPSDQRGVPLPNDYSILITAEDIPDAIPTFRPMTEGFVKKYFDESENPSTAQNSRVAVLIDQMERHMLEHVKVNILPTRSSLSHAQNPANIKTIMTGEESIPLIKDEKTYKLKTGPYSIRYNSYVDTLRDKKSIVTSDVPQITETHHIDYDFRDYETASLGCYAGGSGLISTALLSARVGDSSSCVLFPFEDINGNKFFGYWGQQQNTGYPTFFGSDFIIESVNYICDAYGIDQPDWLDETVDVSPSITPQDIRPTLGYKVYKSAATKDGPYFDITDQVVPYNRDSVTSQVVGMPCIDPDVPCYTVHENFIDEFVEEGETYYYHVTRLEDNGVGGFIESDPSEVIEITVPTENSWSDTNERYLSRNSANTGTLLDPPAINPQALNIPPENERFTVHILDGYRMEENVNVPVLGYTVTGGYRSPLDIGYFFSVPVEDRQIYYRIDNPTNPDNDGVVESILPHDTTSYQYVLGYPSSSNETNYQFKLFQRDQAFGGPSPTDDASLYRWLTYPKYHLYFTKYNPNKNANEAYMHSKIYTDRLGDVYSISINPRGYGHKTDGATDWDTDFFSDRTTKPESRIGYRMGNIFSEDMKLASGSSAISLYASGNASDSSYSTGSLLDWFDIRADYGDLDLSNNGLYALKTNPDLVPDSETENVTSGSTGLVYRLNISNNNISSDSFLPDWRTDPSFGEDKTQWVDKQILVEGKTIYVNAANAGDISILVPNKNRTAIEYLDTSGTYATLPTSEGSIPAAQNLLYSYTLQNLYLDNMKRNPLSAQNDAHILTFVGGGALETLSSRFDSNASGGNQGYDLIAFGYEPNVDVTSSQCGWNKLYHIDLSSSGNAGDPRHRIVSLNLGYSHDDTIGWDNRYLPLESFSTSDLSSFQPFVAKEFTKPHLHGNLAPNLEYLDVSGMLNLRRLHLPKSSDAHDASCTNTSTRQRNSMYINVSNTKIGYDESLALFLNDAIVGYQLNTPPGFTMTVVAYDVKDEEGVECKTPQSVIDLIKEQFADQGKTFIFDGDIGVG